jgi:septal ring factor EnvC (AmiA/AmiB activator)
MSTRVKRQRSSSDGESSVDDDHIRASLQSSFRLMSTQSDIAQLVVEKRILTRKTKLLAAKNAEMEEAVLAVSATHDEMVETLKRSEDTIESASNYLDYIRGEAATEMREHRRLVDAIQSATDAKNKIDCEIADGSGHWQQWRRNTTKQESDAGYWHGEVNVARSEYVKLETEVIYPRRGIPL